MTAISTDLTGRRAVVTGAARGMGAAHAHALAAAGADLLLTDLDADELASVAEEIAAGSRRDVRTVAGDLTDPDAITEIAHAAGDVVDIIVHNAGIMHDWKSFSDTDVEAVMPYFDINVFAPYRLTRALLPALRASAAGRIIFINSQWGQQPDGHSYGYMMSKAAQLGFMKSLSKEFVSERILVNAIAPGAIHTRMVPDEVYDLEVSGVPLGRLGNVDEIAAAVAFLASDAGAFITGQTLAINGGALVPSA